MQQNSRLFQIQRTDILRLICLLSEQSCSDKDIVVNRKEVQDLFPFPAASLIRYYLPDFDFYIVSL